MHHALPGTAPPVRVFAAAIRLLSMNIQRPLGFIPLRVPIAPPPLPIWIFFLLSLSLTSSQSLSNLSLSLHPFLCI